MCIYEFSCSGGEKEWVFAPNIKEAKDFYLRFTGCGNLTYTTVKRVPKSKWDEMYLLDINESEPDPDELEYNEDDYCNGFKIQETFSEYAKRSTAINMIATEY
jgi:hypothetical protein